MLCSCVDMGHGTARFNAVGGEAVRCSNSTPCFDAARLEAARTPLKRSLPNLTVLVDGATPPP